MPKSHKGPGEQGYAYPPKKTIVKLYADGMDVERIAYAMNLRSEAVEKDLGRSVVNRRERAAEQEIDSEAWRLVIDKCMNFYVARDRIKVHASRLRLALSKGFVARGLEDRALDYYGNAHDYALKVYEESKYSLWTVARTIERDEREAKAVLGEDYDPYAEYRIQNEPRKKARKLFAEGRSLKQIAWMLRVDEWELEPWIGEPLLSPAKAELRREVRDRYRGGETVQQICDDTGLGWGKAEEYLDGLYEHRLDLYGIGRDAREEIGRLYLDLGCNAAEASAVTGFDEDLVGDCIEDFYWKREDAEQHREGRERREESGEELPVPAPKPVDPEALAAERRAASSKAAKALGMDEERAAPFFPDGLVPTRAQLFREASSRKALSKAMFDQGADLDFICRAVGAGKTTVEKYLGEDYLPVKEAIRRSRENANPSEAAVALYRQGVPLEAASERVGRGKLSTKCALNDHLRWKYPFCDYIAAYSCEVRHLMIDGGLSVCEAAKHTGASTAYARRMIGTFDARSETAFSLRKHAYAVYLKDALRFDDARIASVLDMGEEDVAAALGDERGRYDYDNRYYSHWEDTGCVHAKSVAQACGLDPDLVSRAAKLGLFSEDEQALRGYQVDAFEALRTMGLVDAHPLPMMDRREDAE